jgi:ubiquinone/menaquinone biosynthesis C-methylase UbiE
MVHWATFGIDRRWTKRMLERVPKGNGPVLDLACGTGISTLSIARRFPQYADLPRLVGNCRAMLKPGGLFMMHDFTLPPIRGS